MKIKYLLLAVAMIGLTAFSNANLDETYINSSKIKSSKIQISDGEKLIAKSDCIGCHNKDKKVVGPSYVDIANKYAANDKNINYLSGKIIKGGSGVWGTLPMGAHASLTKDDAKSMVKYILSLKK
ncbi:c-type cytochrome [uncultured Flavobacterium sp.]|jgi:cytochrome c|uniref:c-type cytochrome n=1 Tax=uncultured Flavobacterium sp. TaxID=165435 RepID=UPI0030EC9588|tara:strand:+ start:114013 stop:114387 length:375 start_codon:yes stop_codon:yes gene_type:complete